MHNGSISTIILRYKKILWLLFVIAFSFLLFEKVYLIEPWFQKVMSIAAYLTWHSVFELISILVSFCVFILPYYTYKQNRRLRGIFIANIFLIMGLLDLFHMLSFKGMPLFLTPNHNANKATTFWIAARLIGAVGITVGSFIGIKKKSEIDRKVFLAISVFTCIGILITVIYYPAMIPKMYQEGIGITPIKKILEYTVIMFLFIAGVLYFKQYLDKKDNSNLAFVFAITMSIFSELAFVRYASVYDINNYLGHVYKFISYFIIFRIAFVNNIEKPYLALFDARNKLKEYAGQLNKLVAKRTEELQMMNQKLLGDLEYARDIQKAILPVKLPNNENVHFTARYYQAERVSGDFYNMFKLDEQWIGLYIGDVSGHGVPAAMLTVFLNQSIKTTRELEENKFEVIRPSIVLKNLYDTYNRVNFKDEVYILLFYAIYNVCTKELVYSSAGLNTHPIVLRDRDVFEIESNGFPICNLMGVYPVDYMDKSIMLRKNDKILFYTDGLVELRNEQTGDTFDEENLKSIIGSKDQSKGIINRIDVEIEHFTVGNALKDDVTYFLMEIQ